MRSMGRAGRVVFGPAMPPGPATIVGRDCLARPFAVGKMKFTKLKI
jgi:hypothetical protein